MNIPTLGSDLGDWLFDSIANGEVHYGFLSSDTFAVGIYFGICGTPEKT